MVTSIVLPFWTINQNVTFINNRFILVSFDRQSMAPVGYYMTWPLTIRAPSPETNSPISTRPCHVLWMDPRLEPGWVRTSGLSGCWVFLKTSTARLLRCEVECFSRIFTVNWKLECVTWCCILVWAWAIPNNFMLLSLFLSEKVREPKIKIFPKLGVNVALISDFLCAYFHISFHLCFINFVFLFLSFFLFACLSSIIAF